MRQLNLTARFRHGAVCNPQAAPGRRPLAASLRSGGRNSDIINDQLRRTPCSISDGLPACGVPQCAIAQSTSASDVASSLIHVMDGQPLGAGVRCVGDLLLQRVALHGPALSHHPSQFSAAPSPRREPCRSSATSGGPRSEPRLCGHRARPGQRLAGVRCSAHRCGRCRCVLLHMLGASSAGIFEIAGIWVVGLN